MRKQLLHLHLHAVSSDVWVHRSLRIKCLVVRQRDWLQGCGISQSENGALNLAKGQSQSVSDRVTGGSGVLSQRKYPWMAWIGTSVTPRSFKCGGSLINDRYVLTAASCIDPSFKNYFVTLGDFNRSTLSDSHSIQIQASAIAHPQYNSSNRNNDIALLKLKIPVNFNAFPHIRPVCLSSTDIPTTGHTITVVGWSSTGVPYAIPENVLKEATMKVVGHATCKVSYPVQATNNTICVQPDDENSCKGDFGSPLLYQTPSGYFLEVGISSYDNGECLPSTGITATVAAGGVCKGQSNTRFFLAVAHSPESLSIADYVDNFIKNNTQDAQWCPAP
ncbi:unnamed protein product [Darwinula stevensoni]|uniref:Peptidase S1 domain-containing protein n=1 Tax=Darwinula stevensoni TaxID=69355 RepID=A0A7R9A2X4_9CRUS|nr:unnamed protein product [Darwinula stevensoni]CAG0889559.1 unnamed protein product [Darwinula stevensoni]